MSEITPNTPNPVREDAYVEELAEKLGIDPQYIPKSPVWRNEEEIRAIAEMFANMSGSSGGGGMKVGVTVTQSGDDTIHTLDKTYKQIVDAVNGGILPYICKDTDDGTAVIILQTYGGGGPICFVEFDTGYLATSENGYPSHTENISM